MFLEIEFKKLDGLKKYSGKVSKFKAITRNSVQIEISDSNNIFELFIDQSWVINKGDDILISCEKDDTGKYCCYAYRNMTKNITGWNHPETRVIFIFFYFIIISISILASSVGIILARNSAPLLLFIVTYFLIKFVRKYDKYIVSLNNYYQYSLELIENPN